ncbi:MAG: branched-chain amino acid ABC transporter permease [Acetobacteraceae bacterium]
MPAGLLLVQTLDGVQLGLLLFLIAAGLTLVFGVMDVVNLAHGVQYMLGAYLCVSFTAHTGSFWLGLPLAAVASFAIGVVLERVVFRRLVGADHLDQVLATFGIILLAEEGVRWIWGPAPLAAPVPALLGGAILLPDGLRYPVYRIALMARGPGRASALCTAMPPTSSSRRPYGP